jgi:hypothetical protein
MDIDRCEVKSAMRCSGSPYAKCFLKVNRVRHVADAHTTNKISYQTYSQPSSDRFPLYQRSQAKDIIREIREI